MDSLISSLPNPELRPILNPKLKVTFTAEFARQKDGVREPLLTTGRAVHGHLLYAEHQAGQLRLISQSDDLAAVYSLPDPGERPLEISVEYSPDSGAMTTKVDGRAVMIHPIESLVTAPADVTSGEDRVLPDTTGARFSGRIRGLSKIIEPAQPR